MDLETEIYQILRKHRLSLKKREEVIVDLLYFIKKRDEAINHSPCCTELCEHENETLHQGNGFIYKTCTDCGEDI